MRIIFNKEVVIAIFVALIYSALIYGEFIIKQGMFVNEKVSDLSLQYNDKVITNKKISEALFDDVLENNEALALLYDANQDMNKNQNREKLYKLFEKKYQRMANKGILQFHFHLANGESFLRFHKKEKYGDSLLFRETIKQIINTKKPIYGFEVGRHFEGFRYVYPLFYKGNYIGSVESSVKAESIIMQMKESLDAKYSMVLKKDIIEHLVDKEDIKKYYHIFCVNKNYYMANSVHQEEHLEKSALKKIKQKLNNKLQEKKAFAISSYDANNNMKVFVFHPIKDIKNEVNGYIFSVRDDNTIEKIQNIQYVKLFIGLFVIAFLTYLFRKMKQKTNSIKQLQNIIDRTTLVSKTDLKGKITYVNDAFEKLSGYKKEELIGKHHNIVRDSSVPKEIFKELWETIKDKKVWHGTFPNRAKDGSKYVVDATIIPILDINNQITEYVALRHDVTELEKYKEILKEQLSDTTKSLNENISYTKQYEEALNNSVAVLKTDTSNKIIYINEKFAKISGFNFDELHGKDCSILRHENHIKTDDCKKIQEKMQNNQLYSIVFTNIAKDGTYFFSDTIVYPIQNTKGEVIEHLHLMHDISEIINLHQELEDTQKEIIYRMGEIGETRSKETGNHVKRVAEYSKLLATLYGLSEEEANMLKLASPMHDIGKVGIPDSVLKKPGKLDKEEWQIMQTHAELGYEMLKHSNRPILKTASIVAQQHHEKWDGTGYPKALKGEDIHIYGRITAIADVFDALGSDRCYKKAWELDKILELFKEEYGKHFDPKLVDLFFKNLEKFLAIRDKSQDRVVQ